MSGQPPLISNQKNGRVRFLSSFRKLKKRMSRKPFSIPKVQDILLNIEVFMHA